MSSVKPAYLIALLVVLLFFVFVKVTNPYREFGSILYWEQASILSVEDVPYEALEPGNRNGPVLMWAAMGVADRSILAALVERGADVNEADKLLKGTPLTGAANFSKHPEIIEELIQLGADIDNRVMNGSTALMLAAQYNTNPNISLELLKQGADLTLKNKQGQTALDIAKEYKNENAISELSYWVEQQ